MITVIFGGSRPEGNSASLAKLVVEGLDYQWIDLTQYRFAPVRDVRHNGGQIDGYLDDYPDIIDRVLESDSVLLVSPVYWYSVSASMKAFIDHWSETLRDKNYRDFKEKMAQIEFRLILVGGDCPKIKARPCMHQIEYSLEFLGARLEDYLIGTANAPGDILKDTYAIHYAKQWHEQLKEKASTRTL